MPWNGSGQFIRDNGAYQGSDIWNQDAGTGTKIITLNHDTHDQDIAAGISNCLTKDMQNEPSAHASWLGKAFYGGTTGGTANAKTLTLSPVLSGYYNGLQVIFEANATSTSTVTLAVNGLTATACKQANGADLLAGQLRANFFYRAIYFGGVFVVEEIARLTTGWIDWTPSYGATGSMTYTTVTTSQAKYMLGSDGMATVEIQASGTTGGTASTGITFTLPVANQSAGSTLVACGIRDAASGAFISGQVSLTNNNSTATVQRYDGANWGLGTGRFILGTFSYRYV